MSRMSIAGLLLLVAGAPAFAQSGDIPGGGYGGFNSVGGGPDYGGMPSARRGIARPPMAGVRTIQRVCVTPRGSCAVGPAPRGARCGCERPGGRLQRGSVR